MPTLPGGAAWSGAWPFVVAWAGLGWVVGIALNRIIHQLPRNRSPLQAPTCPRCDRPLEAVRWASRRCSACGEDTHYDRTEWLAAALLAVLALRFGPSAPLLAYSLYALVLVVIAAIDLRHRYVYAVVTYPALVLAAILTPILLGLDVTAGLIGGAVGYAVFLALYLGGRLLYRGAEPIGKGDLEIAALAGAMVGYPRVLSALFLGGIANALVIAVLLAAGRRSRHDYVPYGPGLCLGTLSAFFLPP